MAVYDEVSIKRWTKQTWGISKDKELWRRCLVICSSGLCWSVGLWFRQDDRGCLNDTDRRTWDRPPFWFRGVELRFPKEYDLNLTLHDMSDDDRGLDSILAVGSISLSKHMNVNLPRIILEFILMGYKACTRVLKIEKCFRETGEKFLWSFLPP